MANDVVLITELLIDASGATEGADKAIGSLERVADASQKAAEGVDQFGAALDSVGQAGSKLGSEATSAAAGVDKLATAVDTQTETLSRTAAESARAEQALIRQSAAVDGTVGATIKLTRTLSELATAQSEVVSRMGVGIQQPQGQAELAALAERVNLVKQAIEALREPGASVAAVIDRFPAAFGGAASSASSLENQLKRLIAAYDPVSAAQEKMAAALSIVTRAQEANLLTADRTVELQSKIAASFDTVGIAAAKAAEAQAKFNAAQAIQEQEKLAAAGQKLREEYDAQAVAIERYEARLVELDKLVATGNTTEQTATVAKEKASQALSAQINSLAAHEQAVKSSTTAVHELAEGHNSARSSVQELEHVVRSLTDASAAGIPIFTALRFEAARIVEALANLGYLPQGSSFLGLIFNPITIGLAAVGAALALTASRALETEQNLRSFGVGAQTVGTEALASGEDIQKMFEKIRDSGVGSEAALKIVNELRLSPIINPQAIPTIESIGARLSALASGGLTQTEQQTKRVAQAVEGGVGAITNLAVEYGAFTGEQAAANVEMARQEGSAKAIQAAIEALDAHLKPASLSMSDFKNATISLGAAWQQTRDAVSNSEFGSLVVASLKGVLTVIQETVSGIDSLINKWREWIGSPGVKVITGVPINPAEAPSLDQALGPKFGPGSGVPNSVAIPPNAAQGAAPGAEAVIASGANAPLLPNAKVTFGEPTPGAPGLPSEPPPTGSVPQVVGATPVATNAATQALELHRAEVGRVTQGYTTFGLSQQLTVERFRLETEASNLTLDGKKVVLSTEEKQQYVEDGLNAIRARAAANTERQNQLEGAKAQGLKNTADAYGVNLAAGIRAESVSQAQLETLQRTSGAIRVTQNARTQAFLEESETAQRAASLLDTKANEELKANSATIASYNLVIEANKRVAEATASGAAAGRQAQIEVQAQEATYRTLATAEAAHQQALIALTTAQQSGNEKAIAAAQALVAKTQVTIDDTKALTENREAQLLANAAVQNATQLSTATNRVQDDSQILQLELGLQGQTTEQIRAQVDLLRAKQTIVEHHVNTLDPEAAAAQDKAEKSYLAQVAAEGQLSIKLQEATANQQNLNEAIRNIADTIENTLTTAISDAFSGKKVQDWGQTIKSVISSVISQLADALFIKPLLGTIAGALGFGQVAQSFGSFGGIAGALGGIGAIGGSVASLAGIGSSPAAVQIVDENGNPLSPSDAAAVTPNPGANPLNLGNVGSGLSLINNFGNIGNLPGFLPSWASGGSGIFGSGGISGFIGNIGSSLGFGSVATPIGGIAGAPFSATIAGPAIPAELLPAGVVPVQSGSLFGATTLGSFAAGAGAGFGAGSLLNSLVGGNQLTGTIGSGVGALAGAAIGSIVPGIGTLIGGLIGGSGGGLFGGLLGNSKPSNNASGDFINLGSGGISGFVSGGVQANDQNVQQISTAIAQFSKDIQSLTGGNLPGVLNVQAGTRDGIKASYSGPLGDINAKFADAQSAVSGIENAILQNIQGVTGTLRTVLDHVSDPSQLQTAVAFAKAYDSLKTAADSAFSSVEKGTQGIGPFETALNQINTTFNTLASQAQQFGLSLDPINAGLGEAIRRLGGDFLSTLDQLASGSTTQFVDQLKAVHTTFTQLTSDAQALGFVSADVGAKINGILTTQAQAILTTLRPTELQTAALDLSAAAPEIAAMAQALLAQGAPKFADALKLSIAEAQAGSTSSTDFLGQLQTASALFGTNTQDAGALGLGSDIQNQIAFLEQTQAGNILGKLDANQLKLVTDAFGTSRPEIAAMAQALIEAGVAATNAAAATTNLASSLDSLQKALTELKTGSLSGLPPAAQAQASLASYQKELAAVQGGNLDEIGNLAKAATDAITALQNAYGNAPQTSDQRTQIISQLQDVLNANPVPAASAATPTAANALAVLGASAGVQQAQAIAAAAAQQAAIPSAALAPLAGTAPPAAPTASAAATPAAAGIPPAAAAPSFANDPLGLALSHLATGSLTTDDAAQLLAASNAGTLPPDKVAAVQNWMVGPQIAPIIGGSFASGTDSTPPGMILVGENGPELIAQRGGLSVTPITSHPGYVWRGSNGAPTTDPAMIEELRALRGQVAALTKQIQGGQVLEYEVGTTGNQHLADIKRNIAPAAGPQRRKA